ncbi:MAG: hypothetical protein QNJ91_02770 [Gammaproteobacteria bacterium]|nr:hypothetical protein [Gammaproteobacteria bacterium]
MKRTIIATLFAIAAGSASANAPFDFQLQFGSEEYVHGADAASITFAPVAPSNTVDSRTALYAAANVDSINLNDFVGTIEPFGPTRISLWEVQRDSPEGIAYRDYHEQYPADTDWDRVAREWRENRINEGLAADVRGNDGRS